MRVLGITLDTWNTLTVSFLAVGAFAAVAGGVSAFAVIKLQSAETFAAKTALDRYKSDVAAQVAEARQAGLAAGTTAGSAILRAAESEREAADARLQTERLKEVMAWRVIPPKQVAILSEVLSRGPGAVNLRYMDGDPEALYFAIQISRILGNAQWRVAPGAVKPANALVFGINLPDHDGADAETLREAFAKAGLAFSIEMAPPNGVGFSIAQIDGAPTLMVGSKVPATP